MLKTIFALFILTTSLAANALTCYTIDSSGFKRYSLVGKPTKSLGLEANAKPCKDGIGLRVEATQEDARCLASAMAACDPTWGGIKLTPNPQVPPINNQCLYFKVESGVSENGLIYHRNLMVYDNSKLDNQNEFYCP